MRRDFLGALVLALATFGLAHAQETTTGTITGQVLDSDGRVVPGATVTLTSAQGTKTLTTDPSGRFFAPYLTPGRYSVKVVLSGFAPVEQKDIDVRLGQRLELSGLTLRVGSLEEVVLVADSAPVVDVTSTTTGGVLDSDFLKRLPVGRTFTDALYLVPSVTASGVGPSNPSISGASGLDNAYVVDGVNITDTGYGAMGSYSLVFGSLGIGVTTDFIKETQVKTGGFEAEYGEATGGVVNVVTQSGANLFHGSVFGFFSPKALEADWRQLQTYWGTVNTTSTENYDVGATLGGPIVKDKAFFFGAFNPQFQRRTFIAPEGYALESLGEQTRKRRVLAYAGKLTWQISSSHRVDLSAFGDPSYGEAGVQRPGALLRQTTDGFSELSSYGGQNQGLRYDGVLRRDWLLELAVAHSSTTIEELPTINTWRVNDFTKSPRQISGGLGGYEDIEGGNTQLSLKSTHILDAGGHHQLRYGANYQDIEYASITQRTGPTFTFANGVQTTTGAVVAVRPDPVYGAIYRASGGVLSDKRTPQHYWAFFAQDTWQIGKHLTVRPGLRYERETLEGAEANPLCHANDSSPAAADGTGPLVPCKVTFDGNWAPRVGATWDLRGDGRSKVYASWGRFFVKIPNDLAVRALTAEAFGTGDYFDAALTRPVPEGVKALGTTQHLSFSAGGTAVIANNARLTYQDEIVGGVEFDAGHRVNLGVRYVHRSIGRVLEDATTLPVAWCDLYGSDVPGNPGLNSCSLNYLIQNIHVGSPSVLTAPGYPDASFEEPQHRYDSVEITANKAFSDGWALVASYRWSRLKGDFEGFYRTDNAQSDPALTSLYDFPTNDPGYTQVAVPQLAGLGYGGDIRYQGCSLGCGVLPNDRTHQLKVYASYAWSALNLGFGLNAGSGRPLTGLWAHPFYGNSGEVPDNVRGSGFETVEGFRKRGHADVRLDLHADYAIRIHDTQRFILLADVFNLFNRQEALWFNPNHDAGIGVANPDFGQPAMTTTAFATPRSIRVGARLEF